jgi:DNA repair ATPase RecN
VLGLGEAERRAAAAEQRADTVEPHVREVEHALAEAQHRLAEATEQRDTAIAGRTSVERRLQDLQDLQRALGAATDGAPADPPAGGRARPRPRPRQ